MVLVSIHPFALRKIFLLVIAVLGVSSALCFADPLFMTRHYAAVSQQPRQARPVITPQATLDQSSVIWRAFANSPEHCMVVPTITFLSPLGYTTHEMGSIISTNLFAGFQSSAESSEVGANSLPFVAESVSRRGL